MNLQDFACAVSDLMWGGELAWDKPGGLEKLFHDLKRAIRSPKNGANERGVPTKNGLINGAYGLSWSQHRDVVEMARSDRYTEAYIAERYDISVSDVREICAAYGIIPGRNVRRGTSDIWDYIPMRKIGEEPESQETQEKAESA